MIALLAVSKTNRAMALRQSLPGDRHWKTDVMAVTPPPREL